jgi:pyrroloquinoline-quinone synthase
MTIQSALKEIVNKRNLLEHPFYKSWSAGTLPREALKVYAQEYGAFIDLLPNGWMTLNDAETAGEEKEHAGMWSAFNAELGGIKGDPQIAQTIALAHTAETLFAARISALGALYAFEVQQPETAKSKLEGLKKFYNLSGAAEKYFSAHSVNGHEAEKILAQIESLSEGDQQRALEACDKMAQALWDGLTGIHESACPEL